MRWLTMPVPIVRAYSEMRPHVEAERQLAQAAAARVAAADDRSYSRATRQLEEAAQRGTGDVRQPRTAADWSAVGMRVSHDG